MLRPSTFAPLCVGLPRGYLCWIIQQCRRSAGYRAEFAETLSLVEQVEVGVDAPSFSAALVSALRQDPDVILVGEMRDLETIAIAIETAETGNPQRGRAHVYDSRTWPLAKGN